VITIAHRINTILSSDKYLLKLSYRILVVDRGQLKEFGDT